jgi:hypothetical protein
MTSTNTKAIVTNEMLLQYDIEFALHQLLENGDESKLAQLAGGKAPSYYSQMLNPNDPQESIWFRAARDFQSLIQIDAERGCKALQIFNEFVRRALPTESLCANYETGQLTKETADVAAAALNGASVDIRLKEAREAKQQAERTYEAVFGEWVKSNGNGRR